MSTLSYLEQFQVDRPLTAEEMAFLEVFPEERAELAQAGIRFEERAEGQFLQFAEATGYTDEIVEVLQGWAERLEEGER